VGAFAELDDALQGEIDTTLPGITFGERDRDLARCDAVRRAIGPDVGLLIDVNTAFDRATALARGREFRHFDPFWYEEPLSPLDWQGQRCFTRSSALAS
jgi:L-alanine-DL-glutamate epimerase-like enolase superfamily enzyme